MPMGLNTIKDVRDPTTSNDGIVAKISFGKGVLYGDLVMCFVNEYPTLAELNAAIKVIENRDDNKYSSESDARSAGYKLAGDSRTAEDTPDGYVADANPMGKLADAINKMVDGSSKTDGKKVAELEKEKAKVEAENEQLKKAMADLVNSQSKQG